MVAVWLGQGPLGRGTRHGRQPWRTATAGLAGNVIDYSNRLRQFRAVPFAPPAGLRAIPEPDRRRLRL